MGLAPGRLGIENRQALSDSAVAFVKGVFGAVDVADSKGMQVRSEETRLRLQA